MQQGYTTTLTIFTDPELGGRTFSAANGEVVYEPDSAADHVYYIRRGQVRLYWVGGSGETRLVEILGPGQWFGAAALAREATYRMRAVVVASAVISEVGVEKLLSALAANPSQFAELNRQLAKKLLLQTEEGSRLVFEDCTRRLVNALLRFSDSAASTTREDGVLLRITHDQLAQAIGVARETVSLTLTQLRQQNLLRTGRNQLVFNPQTLRQAYLESPSGNRHERAPQSELAVEA